MYCAAEKKMLQNCRGPRFKVAKFTHRRRSTQQMSSVAPAHLTFSHVSPVPRRTTAEPRYSRLKQASQRDTSPPRTPIFFFLGRQEVSNIHTTNVWSLEESQAALHLFPERARTSGPPATGDAGESSGESWVSKHTTCWVCQLKLVRVPVLWSSPLTSPVPSHFTARQPASGGWVCTGFVGYGG